MNNNCGLAQSYSEGSSVKLVKNEEVLDHMNEGWVLDGYQQDDTLTHTRLVLPK